MEKLTLELLASSAKDFCKQEGGIYRKELYGVQMVRLLELL